MSRDNIVFTTCGLLLGLIIGSFLIGPRLAPKVASSDSAIAGEAPAATPQAPATPSSAPATGGGNAQTMSAVREQLASLKAAVERGPKNLPALPQLRNSVMDAGRLPERARNHWRDLS